MTGPVIEPRPATSWSLTVADLENFGGGGILSTKPQKFGCLHRN